MRGDRPPCRACAVDRGVLAPSSRTDRRVRRASRCAGRTRQDRAIRTRRPGHDHSRDRGGCRPKPGDRPALATAPRPQHDRRCSGQARSRTARAHHVDVRPTRPCRPCGRPGRDEDVRQMPGEAGERLEAAHETDVDRRGRWSVRPLRVLRRARGPALPPPRSGAEELRDRRTRSHAVDHQSARRSREMRAAVRQLSRGRGVRRCGCFDSPGWIRTTKN